MQNARALRAAVFQSLKILDGDPPPYPVNGALSFDAHGYRFFLFCRINFYTQALTEITVQSASENNVLREGIWTIMQI